MTSVCILVGDYRDGWLTSLCHQTQHQLSYSQLPEHCCREVYLWEWSVMSSDWCVCVRVRVRVRARVCVCKMMERLKYFNQIWYT